MASNLQPAKPKSQSQIHVEAGAIFLYLWLSRNDRVFYKKNILLVIFYFQGYSLDALIVHSSSAMSMSDVGDFQLDGE
jgi:alanine-alpha-ketoisovalerate/valine-pyruvate aminotransferase